MAERATANFSETAIMKVPDRWRRYIEVWREYVEKWVLPVLKEL